MQLKIDEHGREIKHHGTYAFPVRMSHESLFRFDRHSFLWHWHPELEWTYIVDGTICYQVNDNVFHLKKGQGLLCNSNVLHMGKPDNEEDCHYVSITVHPRLFQNFDNSFLEKQYVKPVIDHTEFACVIFDESSEWQKQILTRLEKIEALYQKKTGHYEFQIYLLLMENWLTLWENSWGYEEMPEKGNAESRDTSRLKVIFSYIHEHYAEKITLRDISEQVNICEAECCRLFKKHMGISLFDYLLDYRIERSTSILPEATVAEVSEKTGFSSPAYFTKIFKERMGCTPKEYKKKMALERVILDGNKTNKKGESSEY